MIELRLEDVLELYRRVMEATGGKAGVHDLGGLESALAGCHWWSATSALQPGPEHWSETTSGTQKRRLTRATRRWTPKPAS